MERSPATRSSPEGLTYRDVGVDAQGADAGVRTLAKWIDATFAFNPARPLLPLGYYANVVQIAPDLAVAISTDGVGTKLLIAQELEKYDTVGIDCVAMNANDIICVGARPVSMVDYVAVERADPAFLGALAKGLHDGAQAAAINIPGGEIAQVRELLHPHERGMTFDLVGTCIGTVHPERLLIGRDITPGDAIVGLASSGLHSNGYTLARRVLFGKAQLKMRDRIREIGRTLAEELLEPTRIYVRPVLEMMDEGLSLKALLHITGDGLLNLPRVAAPSGFVIDRLLPTPPIFALIQRLGSIDDGEMFTAFNMGVGFCIVLDPADTDRAIAIAAKHGDSAAVIGYAVQDPDRRVWVPERKLVGAGKTFGVTNDPAPPNPGSIV
jgi:phosphoribosylformylglycinamidine cyclo-ligase